VNRHRAAAVAALLIKMDAVIPPARLDGHERDLAGVRRALGDASFAARDAEGRAMSLDQALDYAFGSEP
jgi:hypothetical protein